jgi:hypothetical protein
MVCNTQNYWVCGLCPSSGIYLEFIYYLEFQTMDKVQKPSNSESIFGDS